MILMEKQASKLRELGVSDKMGEALYQNDIVFDNEDYYRIYFNESVQQIEAYCCTKGYLHNLTPEEVRKFKRIGTCEEFPELLNCEGTIPVKATEPFFTLH
jgi:hypothetical protein